MFNSPAELQVLSRFKVTGIPRKAPQVVSVRWQHPPADWVKVNTDGSYSYDTDKSGAGGVFRNTRGFSLGCFAFPTGNVLAYVAE